MARQVADQLRDREEHGGSVALLHDLAVQAQLQIDGLWIGELVLRHQPRAYGAESVQRLALDPLPGAFQLGGPLRNVVDEHVSEYMIQGLVDGDVLRPCADDHPQLHLPVGLLRPCGQHHIVIRPADATDVLGENDRLGRLLHADFRGMVGIVQADADELLRIGDRRRDAWRALDGRQGSRVELRHRLQQAGFQHSRRDVAHVVGNVVHAPGGIDEGGALQPRFSVASEFHPFSPSFSSRMCRRFGPCAPMTRVCSMSAVREGPVIQLTARGMRPSPDAARSLSHASS